MIQKFFHSSLVIGLIMLLIPLGTVASNDSSQGTLTVEKTYKDDGLRFQVIVSEISDPKQKTTLFKISSKVTNISRNPIVYIKNGCDNIRSEVKVHDRSGPPLPPPDDRTCPGVIVEKTLMVGQNIQQENLFVADDSSKSLSSDQYLLSTLFYIGSIEKMNKISFETYFREGISLPTPLLNVHAKLTKSSSSYQLKVNGTGNNQIKKIFAKVGKSRYLLKINTKKNTLSLSKKISVTGNPPETCVLQITYKDGTLQYLDIPIELSPEK